MGSSSAGRAVCCVILDGWGEAPAWGGNAIATARTPVLDRLSQSPIATTLEAAGSAVGLADGEPGNSEVGHLTIGAGRVLRHDRTRISEAITDGTFFRNQVLIEAFERAKVAGTTVHLIGLASQGGVHGHSDHLHALLELAARIGVSGVLIHVITDGRDAPPQEAAQELDRIRHWCTELGAGRLASIVGRSFAMDRDQHWDRTERAYQLLTESADQPSRSALAAVSAAYTAGQTDEFIEPIWLDSTIPPIRSGDTVIGWNFRPDRSRQLFDALANPAFTGFRRPVLAGLTVVTLVPYWPDVAHAGIQVAFPPAPVTDPLGAVVSAAGAKQLRIAESEKYAHVTYFVNGGREAPFDGEERQLIPSKLRELPSAHPAMQTQPITRALISAMRTQRYRLVVANLAAPDMVGHTGNLRATVAACETVDEALGQLAATAAEFGTILVITADHGNAEQLVNPVTNEPDTHHTTNPVPFIVFDPTGHVRPRSWPHQSLTSVAPTVLTLLGLSVPHSMTGQPLATLISNQSPKDK